MQGSQTSQGQEPRYLKVGPGKRSRVIYRQSDIICWLDRQSFASTSEYTTYALTTRGLCPRTPGIFGDSDGA
jgi:hypothetical protein